MSSAIDICNQALLLLGASPIVSFEDDTAEADALQVHYAPTKKAFLRGYAWNCAIQTVTVALLADKPLRYDYAFAWPDDALRIIDVIDASHNGQRMEWEVEGRTIHTDFKDVYVRAVMNIPEPQLDAHVEDAFMYALARKLSYTLTSDTARETNIDTLYEKALMEARTTDAQEASHKVFRIKQLDAVRHGGRYI